MKEDKIMTVINFIASIVRFLFTTVFTVISVLFKISFSIAKVVLLLIGIAFWRNI